MDNVLIQVKTKERLNKRSSEDYDNLESWQIAEAFNKAQIELVRRQIHGNNQRQEGDESTKMMIDDMQRILIETNMTLTAFPLYHETGALPANYFYFKRISVESTSDCCDNRGMRVHLEEVADVDELLADELSKPSIEWGQTFCTMSNNRTKIYTNGDFTLDNAVLHYYRRPIDIEILGAVNPSTDVVYTVDVPCEFKDDFVELIIDEAVSILAGDMELFNTHQRTKQAATQNN